MTTEEIAETVYNANIKATLDNGRGIRQTHATEIERLQPTWEGLSDVIKDIYCTYIEFVLNLPESMNPQQIQERWIAHEQQRGWKFGERLDSKKKTNPFLLPFDLWTDTAILQFHITTAVVNILRGEWDKKARGEDK